MLQVPEKAEVCTAAHPFSHTDPFSTVISASPTKSATCTDESIYAPTAHVKLDIRSELQSTPSHFHDSGL
jgi:hypothetical protein